MTITVTVGQDERPTALLVAVQAFAAALGLGESGNWQSKSGSWFGELRLKLGRLAGSSEAQDAYAKGKQALELEYLARPHGKATKDIAAATSDVIRSLKGIEDAVVALGPLYIVKVTDDGSPRIVSMVLSPTQRAHVASNPHILSCPRMFWEHMVGEKLPLDSSMGGCQVFGVNDLLT